MCPSTWCVVDSVNPLRRSPLGHTEMRGVRRDPDAPRLQSSACSQCHSPTTLQVGRPARRDIGLQVSRRCAAGRCSPPLPKTFRKLPGTEQGGLPWASSSLWRLVDSLAAKASTAQTILADTRGQTWASRSCSHSCFRNTLLCLR